MAEGASRAGVFVCTCGGSIGLTTGVRDISRKANDISEVACVETLDYACHAESRKRMTEAIKQQKLDRLVVAELRKHAVDLVCLAGFMRLLSAYFVREFPLRILNIHPGLLPAFPGLEAQHQALDHGVKVSGCTVHFVDEFLDAGPIIVQRTVPVLDSDTAETLSARILEQEHQAYSEAIRIVLSGNFHIQGRRVLLGAAAPPRG
ncbi:MAG: phosphoribosylglycinamide formyltransferase [Bryobacteraceae bacterium]